MSQFGRIKIGVVGINRAQIVVVSFIAAMVLLGALLTRAESSADALTGFVPKDTTLSMTNANSVVYISSTLLLEDTGTSLIEITPQNQDWIFGQFYILEENGILYVWLNNKIETPNARLAVEQRLESQDGLVWTNRLDTNLVDTTYDYHVLHGIRHVIHNDSVYEGWESYYYNVVSGMWVRGIRYITSADGITWNVVNQTALISGEFVNLHKEAGNYFMWVMPNGDSHYTGSKELRWRMSSLPGSGWGDWQTGGTLVMVDGTSVSGPNRVRKLADGTYQLFYTTDMQRINLAVSTDGIAFATQNNNLLDMSVVLPDYFALRDFAVVDMDGEDWFYFAYRDTSNNEHLAVSRPEPAVLGLTAINDSPTLLGQTTTLTGTITQGNNVTYTWGFGDGGAGNGRVITHTYPSPGAYTAVVTASNPVNTLTATTTVLVGETIANLTATSDAPTYVGQMTHLTAKIVAGTDVNYIWDLGDGTSDVGRILSHTYPAAGVYTAVVTAQNSFSTLTATTDITIIPYNNYLPVVAKNVCSASASPIDVILAVDTSGSMATTLGGSNQTKLEAAQSAASTFIDLLHMPPDQAGLVSFADDAKLEYPLTIDANNLKNTLSLLTANGATRIDLALLVSRDELIGPRHNQGSAQALILLSDGQPTDVSEEEVLAAADLVKSSGIVVYTIGLGQDTNEVLMKEIASSPLHYYYAPSTNDLTLIYEQIAGAIRCP